jgi:hypothetical protein
MPRFFVRAALAVGLLACIASWPVAARAQAASEIVGRWNLTVQAGQATAPAWLEVSRSGPNLVGQYVGAVGSARPISRIEYREGEMRFTIPAQYERGGGDVVVVGRAEGGGMRGHLTVGAGARQEWSAARAPELRRDAPAPVWGEPTRLIGDGLTGWRPIGGTNHWEVADGVLRNRASGANLATERAFEDFRLQLEFRVPDGGNSGVYLRGRYEVQIAGSAPAQPSSGDLGAIYGFLAPTEIPYRPREWNTLEVTLIGRLVTVALNGRTIICNSEIPGITGGALDSDEGAPGPILLQGDHGPVEFRNMVVTPAS